MARGRRCKLTPEITGKLAAILQQGHTIEDACTFVGIGTTSFHRWMELGNRAKRGQFRDFRVAIGKARARCVIALVDVIQQKAQTDWKAAAWLLERLYPHEYGRRYAKREKFAPDDEPAAAFPTVIFKYSEA